MKYIDGHNFHKSYDLKTIELNWDVEGLSALYYERPPATFYFSGLVYSEITLLVPKGTKAVYEAHELWGLGFNIVEKE